MTEIKQVEDYKTFWKRSSGEIITYTEGTLMDIIQLARKDILSLLTTIESQKVELLKRGELIDKWQLELFGKHILIESQKEEIESLNNFQKGYKVVEDDLNSQIESLKAITELAVPALKWYADKKNWNLGVSISMGSAHPLHEAIKSDKGKIAITTLSEIERLQNG